MICNLQRPALVLVASLFLGACNSGTDSPSAAAAPDVAAPAAGPAPADVVAPATPSPYTPRADAVSGGLCALDAVDGQVAEQFTAAEGETVLLSGWFFADPPSVPTDARLIFEAPTGSYAFNLQAGGERPDVATAHGSDTLRLSGYNASVSLASLPVGAYALSIVHTDGTRTCALGKPLEVTPPA